jgi:ATP-dependent metalloprotease FtsH
LNLFGEEEESEDGDDDTPTIGTAAKLMKQASGNDEPVERPDTKFDDVKGLGEVREQLEQVKDYIMNQSKYEKIGAGLPRGILLSGPPGVGKTLLGRAIAGECGVPFYFVASSTIDGMYVGTGAKRLTKLFKNARSHDEGAVIFFDELDAVGGKRTAGASINPYTRLTINKLLAEMDGFSTSDKVIVVASTNLPDVLDEALTRSGRFDQHIKIGRPTKEDRMEILRYYLDKVASDTSIDAEKWAKVLAGAVGADMEKIVNFAAFISAKRCSDIVEDEDIKVGILRHYMGTEQRGRLEGIPEIDLKVNAYHQAGKAVCHHLIKAKGELNTITIIPRNGVSGKSIYKQLEYTDNMTRKDILNQVKITLGGPIAEQIITTEVFGIENQSDGNRADAYDYAKKTVRRVVKEFGMGVGDKQFMFHVHDGASEYLNKLCEDEAQRILDDVYKETKKMIVDNKKLVKILAEAVLEYETVSGLEVKEVILRKKASAVAELRSENKRVLDERRLKMKENQFVDLEKK